MAVRPTNYKLPDTYFELVRQFPLTHLRDEQHLSAAQAMIDRLLAEDLDAGEQEYLHNPLFPACSAVSVRSPKNKSSRCQNSFALLRPFFCLLFL
jgi:hypothetical protein